MTFRACPHNIPVCTNRPHSQSNSSLSPTTFTSNSTLLYFSRLAAIVCLALYILPFSISSTRYAKPQCRIGPNCSNIACVYTLLVCRLCCTTTPSVMYHPLSIVRRNLIIVRHSHRHDLVLCQWFPLYMKTSNKKDPLMSPHNTRKTR